VHTASAGAADCPQTALSSGSGDAARGGDVALTPQDVQNKVFSPTRFRTGYNEDEVDTFLDEVEAELTRLLDENSDLRRQLDEARRSGELSEEECAALEDDLLARLMAGRGRTG